MLLNLEIYSEYPMNLVDDILYISNNDYFTSINCEFCNLY